MTVGKFSIVPALAVFDLRLSPGDLRVLCAICYHGAQKESGSFPSFNTISRELSVARRSVIRCVKALCALGYLSKESREGPNGRTRSNIYRVAFDTVVCDSDYTQDVVFDSDTGVTRGGDTSVTRGVTPVSPPIEQENTKKNIYNNAGTKKGKNGAKVSLVEWEKNIGCRLCVDQLMGWVKEKGLNPGGVKVAIEEFRDAVIAGGNQYADFAAAFKTWLRNGYLRLKMDQLRAKPTGTHGVTFQDRGNSL